jgi:hypothetical protein
LLVSTPILLDADFILVSDCSTILTVSAAAILSISLPPETFSLIVTVSADGIRKNCNSLDRFSPIVTVSATGERLNCPTVVCRESIFSAMATVSDAGIRKADNILTREASLIDVISVDGILVAESKRCNDASETVIFSAVGTLSLVII